jgi:glyoxylase-like metal-dependent hydrolase (beta-lactamase superfamily II)
MTEHPFGARSNPLRVDIEVDPPCRGAERIVDRVEVLCLEGHVPGHLCVLVDGSHFISGDMWLPATTSTITPGTIALAAGIPPEDCGIVRYIESCESLLAMELDACMSYPSHEHIFKNPKRMAMRDLELFSERLELVHQVLSEHERRPMRVLDLAWGGEHRLPIWKLNHSKQRLMLAHDEATALVEDLLRLGDLREVEPERYLWTGGNALRTHLAAALREGRAHYGHLEFRSRGR